jgi:hypothetical protein
VFALCEEPSICGILIVGVTRSRLLPNSERDAGVRGVARVALEACKSNASRCSHFMFAITYISTTSCDLY